MRKARKWSASRRRNFNATIDARRAREHPSLREQANEKLAGWDKQLQREEIVASILNAATDGRPETIYVLENGALKRYMLRNVYIYIPVEKESSL